ncbi:MAG TPA: hypothetical protein VGL81_06705 [Polyangiaceae bacterium]
MAATAATAQAQEQLRPGSLQAPSRVAELTFGTGYVQDAGQLMPTQRLLDAAGSGFGFVGSIDYRLRPRWSLGVHGEWDELTARGDQGARTLSSTAGVTFHARPRTNGDPWVRLGTGYRMFSEANRDTILVHAFEVARLTLGYDFRTDSQVAFSPVVGADVDLFDWQYAYADHALNSFARPQVGAFFFAGMQARIDLGAPTPPRHAAATGSDGAAPSVEVR